MSKHKVRRRLTTIRRRREALNAYVRAHMAFRRHLEQLSAARIAVVAAAYRAAETELGREPNLVDVFDRLPSGPRS